MTVQEVVKAVIKGSGLTQKDIADRNGKCGGNAISMMIKSNSMRVDNLVMILNSCGYELVARSGDGSKPEYVIGNGVGQHSQRTERPDQFMSWTYTDIERLIQVAVQQELEKRGIGCDVPDGPATESDPSAELEPDL